MGLWCLEGRIFLRTSNIGKGGKCSVKRKRESSRDDAEVDLMELNNNGCMGQ